MSDLYGGERVIVDACNICGAPIYDFAIWYGITPPPRQYSCLCRGNKLDVQLMEFLRNSYPKKEKPPMAWECSRCNAINAPHVSSCSCTALDDSDLENGDDEGLDVVRFNHEFHDQVCIHCNLSDLCEETECPALLRDEVERLFDFNESGLMCSKHWIHPSKCCSGSYSTRLVSQGLSGRLDKLQGKLNIAKPLLEEIQKTLRLIESGVIPFHRVPRKTAPLLLGLITVALAKMEE